MKYSELVSHTTPSLVPVSNGTGPLVVGLFALRQVTSGVVPASIELISTWMGGREFELYNDRLEGQKCHEARDPSNLPYRMEPRLII